MEAGTLKEMWEHVQQLDYCSGTIDHQYTSPCFPILSCLSKAGIEYGPKQPVSNKDSDFREAVPYYDLEMQASDDTTYKVCNLTVSFELVPGKLPCFSTSRRVLNAPRRSDYGPVEREGTRALEELSTSVSDTEPREAEGSYKKGTHT